MVCGVCLCVRSDRVSEGIGGHDSSDNSDHVSENSEWCVFVQSDRVKELVVMIVLTTLTT